MPDRRTGAPGSFGAPLDELLPRLGSDHRRRLQIAVDIHRKRAQAEPESGAGEPQIFMLNQRLFERATR